MFELTDTMRQKDDKSFAELLNRLRQGMQNPQDIAKLKSRLLPLDLIPASLPHLYTINEQVHKHNLQTFIDAQAEKKCTISALDTVSGDASEDLKLKIL